MSQYERRTDFTEAADGSILTHCCLSLTLRDTLMEEAAPANMADGRSQRKNLTLCPNYKFSTESFLQSDQGNPLTIQNSFLICATFILHDFTTCKTH